MRVIKFKVVFLLFMGWFYGIFYAFKDLLMYNDFERISNKHDKNRVLPDFCDLFK